MSLLVRVLTLLAVVVSLLGPATAAPARASAWPDGSSTGVPASVELVAYSGPLRITEDGTTLEGVDIQGCVDIEAANVTIRNSRIRCSSGGREHVVANGQGPTLLEHVELDGMEGERTMGVQGSDIVVRFANIHSVGDGIKAGSDSRYEYNYVHDLVAGDNHNDGLQMSGGSNTVIRGNRIVHRPEQTSAALIKSDLAPIRNVTVEGNWFEGGNYTLYVVGQGPAVHAGGQDTPYETRDMVVRANRFSRTYRHGAVHIRNVVGLTWECNRWEDGAVLAWDHPDNHTDNTDPTIREHDCDTLEPPPTDRSLTRVAGTDRIATAVSLSRRAFDQAERAVIARADVYADVLAAAPLAATLGAPILLTHRDQVAPAVLDELARLGTTHVTLVGGTAALGPAIASTLASRGLGTDRIAGTDRFATAALVAGRLPASDMVFVAEGANADPGRGWPDALTASWMGATLRAPVLLVERDRLPEATAAVVGAETDVVIVGGTGAVAPATAASLRSSGASVRRISGPDRFATSVAGLQALADLGHDRGTLYVVSGDDWPDGLVASATAAITDGRLLLHPGAGGHPATAEWLDATPIEDVLIVGGPSALSGDVETRLRMVPTG